MRLGVSFHETLSGSYWRLAEPTIERAIAVRLRFLMGDVREFLRDKTWRIAGTIDAEGLVSGAEIDGFVGSRLMEEQRLPYRMAFTGDDRSRYELCGQKEWSGLEPIESLTVLPVSLFDPNGDELARGTLRFDIRADLWRGVTSVRLLAGR